MRNKTIQERGKSHVRQREMVEGKRNDTIIVLLSNEYYDSCSFHFDI